MLGIIVKSFEYYVAGKDDYHSEIADTKQL
jgi:hypothetical protein